ncbi:MAG: PilZ domain-containing protein [Candidatus Omnitrophota bacterium]
MENQRRLIRLETRDFLEIKPVNEVAKRLKAEIKDFSLMGICFNSEVEWQRGQVLIIDYFLSDDLDSVRVKVVVAWSEFIDHAKGYFCGAEVIGVDQDKQDKFAAYYYKKLRERFY